MKVVFPLIVPVESLGLLLAGEPGPGGLEGELPGPDHLDLALAGVARAVALGAGGGPEAGHQVLDPGVLRMRDGCDTEKGEQHQGEAGGHGQVRGHTLSPPDPVTRGRDTVARTFNQDKSLTIIFIKKEDFKK